ncbi:MULTISPECIES: SRPBCC family protein [Acinetobacter]|nr:MULTISPECIES: hypothetical protein [Acinetobacter]MDK4793912.1 hypothetical protein [Acinetobacter sp.]
MLESIEVSQFINQSPQKVWEALTIPELLQQWWAWAVLVSSFVWLH